ncbi:MAG: DUF4292 domain-containing protein [Bacteroidota bacterium]|nr:DUF4292 domain-containing protein [Bacteroidota bacterium]
MKNFEIPLKHVRAWVFLTTILFFSCSAPRGIDTSSPLDPLRVIDAVKSRNACIRSIQGSGSISIETARLSNSGNIRLRLRKPDSLAVDISGPFGIGVAKGLFTSKEFVFYNSIENTLTRGKTSQENLRNLLYMPIEFREILDILSGSVGFDHLPAGAEPEGELRGDIYCITYRSVEGTREYEIDPKYEAVTRYVRKSPSGEVLEVIRFRDYRRKSNVYLPTVITIDRPGSNEHFMLMFDQLTVNEGQVDFSFQYPKSAVEVNI